MMETDYIFFSLFLEIVFIGIAVVPVQMVFSFDCGALFAAATAVSHTTKMKRYDDGHRSLCIDQESA